MKIEGRERITGRGLLVVLYVVYIFFITRITKNIFGKVKCDEGLMIDRDVAEKGLKTR